MSPSTVSDKWRSCLIGSIRMTRTYRSIQLKVYAPSSSERTYHEYTGVGGTIRTFGMSMTRFQHVSVSRTRVRNGNYRAGRVQSAGSQWGGDRRMNRVTTVRRLFVLLCGF